MNTTVPPSRSNTAPRGTCSTPTCGAPLMVRRPVSPGRRSVGGAVSASVAEKVRDGPAGPGPKKRAGMMLPTDVTLAATARPPSASRASVASWPTARRARSFSSMPAPISSWLRSSTSATGAPPCTWSPVRYSLKVMPEKKKLVLVLSLTETTPSIDALSSIRDRIVVARVIAKRAFVSFSRATASAASSDCEREARSPSS